MKKRLWFQIGYSVLVLLFFCYLGFSIYYLIPLAILFVLIIALKGKIYRKVQGFAEKKIPRLKKLPSWLQKAIIIVSLILVYFLIKEIVFLVLKNLGIDLQKMLIENVNRSLSK